MHQHECINKLLNLMINFNLVKNIIFLCFYEHKYSKLTHFSSISKEANFRVLHCGGGDKGGAVDFAVACLSGGHHLPMAACRSSPAQHGFGGSRCCSESVQRRRGEGGAAAGARWDLSQRSEEWGVRLQGLVFIRWRSSTLLLVWWSIQRTAAAGHSRWIAAVGC
jgi:hypothetical protein